MKLERTPEEIKNEVAALKKAAEYVGDNLQETIAFNIDFLEHILKNEILEWDGSPLGAQERDWLMNRNAKNPPSQQFDEFIKGQINRAEARKHADHPTPSHTNTPRKTLPEIVANAFKGQAVGPIIIPRIKAPPILSIPNVARKTKPLVPPPIKRGKKK